MIFSIEHKNLSCLGRQKRFLCWRSGRDLNPRAAFDGNTISSRARYDLFDTTAYSFRCEQQNLLYQIFAHCQYINGKNRNKLWAWHLLKSTMPTAAPPPGSLQFFRHGDHGAVQGVAHALHSLAHSGLAAFGPGTGHQLGGDTHHDTHGHAAEKSFFAHFTFTPLTYAISISRFMGKIRRGRCQIPP